jgi:hypothetical protein
VNILANERHNLHDFLAFYQSLGLAVIPLSRNSKQPKIQGWPSKSAEELLIAFEEGDNVGIRIEKPIFVIDVDNRSPLNLILEEIGQTLVVETRRGYHLYLKAKSHYSQNNKKSRLIQLLAEGCQVVAPPSVVDGHTYRFVDPNAAIATLDDRAVEKIERIVEALAKHEKIIVEFANAWSEGHRHNLSLWLNGALRKAGVPRFEAAVIVKSICLLAGDPEINDRLTALKTSYERDIAEIAGWPRLREELASIVGEEKAEGLLSLLPRPREEAERREGEKHRSVLSLTIPSGPLVLEAIGMQNGLGEYDARLLVYGPDGFNIVESYKTGDVIIAARPPRSYPYRPYVVESFEEKARLELIDLIHREIELFIDAEPEEKATFTAFIILSYVQECFDALPYLYLVGDNESGKSHLLNLMAELCYRPLAGVSHTAADLYSYLEDDGLPLTIIEDEFQGSEKDSEKMKIYKSGYKKGTKVARVVTYEGGRRVDYFNSFGLKMMAAEKLVENKGLMQRCIIVEMVEGYPEKDHYDAEDYSRFSWLRSELLKWRMRVLAGHESLPKVEADWLRGRHRELYLPLLTVLHGSLIYHALEKFLRQRAEEKQREREGSLEAAICRAVVKLLVDGTSEVEFPEVWGELKAEVGGVEELDKNGIARSMHSDVYGNISKRDVANILAGKLGMVRRRTTKNGSTMITYTPHWPKLARALRKYGVDASMPQMPHSLGALAPRNPG